MILDEVDPGTRDLLERFGFDLERFAQLRARVADGSLSVASNAVTGIVEPVTADDLTPLSAPGEPGFARMRDVGLEALQRGEVAALVLAGGMATRFGGVVKANVEAVDGRSFLEAKLDGVDRLAAAVGVDVPVAVMTSFQTDAPIREALAERGGSEPLIFSQFVSLRLEPDGSLFREADGRASPYGPGHGDLLEAIRVSETLGTLRARGVHHVVVSNVDNLGARIDPVVVGAHVLAGAPLTVEVAEKEGDLGGAPARVDGRVQIVEAPRFPADFDQSSIAVFNTNTATFTVDALDRDYDLTWMVVERKVEDRVAIQLERVFHEASSSVLTTLLVVPRSGPRGRFYPIKTPDDLERARPALRELLSRPPLD